MDLLEEARLAWLRAQADLQSALKNLETLVLAAKDADAVAKARDAVTRRQEAADLHLQRYITQLGKSKH